MMMMMMNIFDNTASHYCSSFMGWLSDWVTTVPRALPLLEAIQKSLVIDRQ